MNNKYKVINLYAPILWFSFVIAVCLAAYLVVYQVIQLPHVSYFESLDGKQIPIVIETSDDLILSLLQRAEIIDPSEVDEKIDGAFRDKEFISKNFRPTILSEKWYLKYESSSPLVLYSPDLQLKTNIQYQLAEKYTKSFTAGTTPIDESFIHVDGAGNFAVQLSYNSSYLSNKYYMSYLAIIVISGVSFYVLAYLIQIISFPFIRWRYKEYFFVKKEAHRPYNRKLDEPELDFFFEYQRFTVKKPIKMLVITTLNNHRVYFLV